MNNSATNHGRRSIIGSFRLSMSGVGGFLIATVKKDQEHNRKILCPLNKRLGIKYMGLQALARDIRDLQGNGYFADFLLHVVLSGKGYSKIKIKNQKGIIR